MTHTFDQAYWSQHWQQGPAWMGSHPPNPYLSLEVVGLAPGTALDAGCGAGAEAIWLAAQGWQVTAADISAEALSRAAERAAASGLAERITWVEADLSAWEPDLQFDLVTTSYAHPAMPQLEFYDRIAAWVAPGGTLLVVGHLHAHGAGDHDHGAADDHDHHPPVEATVTAGAIAARLDRSTWDVVTADERHRTLAAPDGRPIPLHDVVVRAIRRG